MARLIAVANLKGGCGKSTIAVNLACELAQKTTVELIDAETVPVGPIAEEHTVPKGVTQRKHGRNELGHDLSGA